MNSSQLIAPGTPMSVDGSGFMAGYQSGMVQQWLPGAESPRNPGQRVGSLGEYRGSAGGTASWSALDNGATFIGVVPTTQRGRLGSRPSDLLWGASVPSKSPQATNWSELQARAGTMRRFRWCPSATGSLSGCLRRIRHHNGAIEMFTGLRRVRLRRRSAIERASMVPEPMTP